MERELKNHGLTSLEATERLKQYGPNARPEVKSKAGIIRLFHIITEPMMALLLATAVIYFFLGDKIEGTVIFLSIIPILLIEFFQERKTDEAIVALDKMMVTYAQVYRDGQLVKLNANALVPGDVIYLTAGDRVPADGCLLNSPGLMVDESILTGESMAVVKSVVEQESANLADDEKLNQGTMVVQGEGFMLVTKTGTDTAYGRLGSLLENIKTQKTPLQKKIEKLVRLLAIWAILVATSVGIVLSFEHGILKGILGSLTIAISIIPEEFPIIFIVFLIVGVWRMSKKKALVRSMAMVETLGSATVICTDKTGTLTAGQMTLNKICYQDGEINCSDLKKPSAKLKSFMIPALLSLEQIAVDPIEIEVQRFAEILGIKLKSFYHDYTLVKNSSFSSKSKTVSHVWQSKADNKIVQYTAGAPESILKHSKISVTEKKKIENIMLQSAAEGYRVIAIASRETDAKEGILLQDMNFIGLLVMSDPPRPGVKEAIEICQKAGIKIIMITGDNPLTAHNIAETIGLSHNDEIIGGHDLAKMSPVDLRETVKSHNIFARIKPEQKYMIVEALQQNGEVVAMTGDGVNDAPALKKADIGIAMGERGTEVARSAAGIILLDDNFSTIVKAIEEGRRIYDNLRQAFVFLLSLHLPIIGLALVPLALGQNFFFYPVHVIFLELFSDPASVLGFERDRARRGLMSDPPRQRHEPLVNPNLWLQIVFQGLVIFGISFIFYYYFGLILGNIDLGRTLAFASLIFSQVLLIMLIRDWDQTKSNRVIISISCLTLIVLHVILFVPWFRDLFYLVPISWEYYLLSLGTSVSVMVLMAVVLKLKKKYRI